MTLIRLLFSLIRAGLALLGFVIIILILVALIFF